MSSWLAHVSFIKAYVDWARRATINRYFCTISNPSHWTNSGARHARATQVGYFQRTIAIEGV